MATHRPVPNIQVLYQDPHLVVVDKPSGVLAVNAPGRRGPTLVDLVSTVLGTRAQAVHRLDEETTGAVVLAISDEGQQGLSALFREHDVERIYLALVTGTPSPPAGRIQSRLQEGADGVVRVVQRGGEIAVTHYELLGRRHRCSLVRCRLETGRRNQIRAHMAAIGCPLAGDRKYGYRQRPGERFPRVMLHALRLAFTHPVTGQPVAVEVEPAEPELRQDTNRDVAE